MKSPTVRVMRGPVSSRDYIRLEIEHDNRFESLTAIARDLPPVVYFVRADQHRNLIKIGHTANLASRIAHYGGWHTLLALQPGSHDDEQAMHRRFRAYRALGREWFRPAPEIMDYIAELQTRLGVRRG